MRLTGYALRLVAAALVAAATYAGPLGAISTPAAAAACSDADGVTVVVDFHGLGGGVQQVCDADGGGTKASTLFTGNGFDLAYVQKQPGFVCRIDAKPADDPCVNTPPADAYWGLWWSDGTKSTWTYSSLGASSLEIPDGGSVAFSWNSGSGQDKPGVNPPVHETAPSPTPSPSPTGGGNGGGNNGGGNGGGGNNNGGGATAAPTPEPTAPTSTEPSESESASPAPTETQPTEAATEEPSPIESETATAEADPTPETAEIEPTASPPAAAEGGLPRWLAPVVVVLLFAAAAAVAVVRRRRNPASLNGP